MNLGKQVAKDFLFFLLEASEAAEEAKKRGLKYAGYGYWEDKSGTKVAQTKDGKLVPIEKGGEKKPAPKPSVSKEKESPEGGRGKESKGKMTLVGVYSGRFQPFGRHHFQAYKQLESVTGGNTYVATSNTTDNVKSPFNFNEKKVIIEKYGIPASHIVKTKNPYTPTEILKHYDPKTTALVVIFGAKDAGRLGGKYYVPFRGTKDLEGYKDKGYYIIAQHESVKVGGKELSGTMIRQFLGSHKIDAEKKKKLFKAIFGWYDPALFDMITKKVGAITPKTEAKDTKPMFSKGTREQQLELSRLYTKALKAVPSSLKQKEIDAQIQALRKKMGLDYIKTEGVLSSKNVITEGGAYGHMSHPFDDQELTFGDLKEIIVLALQGHLDKETKVMEKLDGQALSVSWVNGKLVAARNKGQLKNGGANALDINGIKNMFAGRGAIEESFTKAMEDLEAAISGLTEKQKNYIFQNGKNFMALEVIYPKTENVLPYGQSSLVFHGIISYDNNGNPVGENKEYARTLEGMIRRINANVQKTFKIEAPSFITVPPSQDFSKKSKYFISKVNNLKGRLGMKDSDTLALYHQRWWENFITKKANAMKYNIPNNVLVSLTKRWAFDDKSNKMIDILSGISNPAFADWVKDFDKNDHDAQLKENMKPFENIFLELGAEVLSNASGFLAANPSKTVQTVKKKVDAAVNQLKGSSDLSQLSKLRKELERIQSIGGFNKIVPAEGLVFTYGGKTYKLTGAFAPVNQILGILKYGD